MEQRDKLFKYLWRIEKSIVISLLFLCAFFVPAWAEGENNQEVVRVGYFLCERQQEGKEGELKSGFSYDYLQKVRSYTGWKYEYVYGSFNSLLEGMSNGTVDIMGNISKTDARLAKVDYSEMEQGVEDYFIVIPNHGSKISKDDLSTLDGKRVGVPKGSIQDELFRNWLRERGYNHVNIVEYDTQEERFNDFNMGKLDAILNTYGTEREEWRNLVHIGSSPTYFVISKKKPWLKTALDKAQREIINNNPDYNYQLKSKYTRFSKADKHLSAEEERWVKIKEIIRIGYINAVSPYCYTDSNDLMQGVYREIFSILFKNYGLYYSYKPYVDYQDMLKALHKGELDAIMPVYVNQALAEKQGFLLSDEVASMAFVLVMSNNSRYGVVKKVAVSKIGSLQPYLVKIKHPSSEIVWKNDLNACLEAVKNGEVDGTYISSSFVNHIWADDKSLRYAYISDMREMAGLAIGVREDSQPLLSIVNKTLSSISETDLTDSIIRNTRQNSEENPYYIFWKRNKIVLIVAIIALVTVSLVLTWAYYDSERKKLLLTHKNEELEKAFGDYRQAMQKFEKADYDRRRDFLTGLYNRQEMFEMLKNVVDGKMPPIQAMYMLDIDDYKSYNDHYGHEAGDNILQIIGGALLNYAKINEMEVYRYGGEEILLVSFDAEQNAAWVARDLVQLVRALELERDDVAKKKITVSLGYTTNNKRFEKMVSLADAAMYVAKKQGKDQAVEG